MSAEIRIEGLDDVLDQLQKIPANANIDRALGECCSLIERSAKQKAPKDNGELRRSITSKVEDHKGIVFTPLEYAPYVEFGTGLFAEEGGRMDVPWCYQDDEGNWHTTSGQTPQPFMRPALEENKEAIKQILLEAIRKARARR